MGSGEWIRRVRAINIMVKALLSDYPETQSYLGYVSDDGFKVVVKYQDYTSVEEW